MSNKERRFLPLPIDDQRPARYPFPPFKRRPFCTDNHLRAYCCWMVGFLSLFSLSLFFIMEPGRNCLGSKIQTKSTMQCCGPGWIFSRTVFPRHKSVNGGDGMGGWGTNHFVEFPEAFRTDYSYNLLPWH